MFVHSGSHLFISELSLPSRLKYRTECWLERCMYEERICQVEENVSFVPFAVEHLFEWV